MNEQNAIWEVSIMFDIGAGKASVSRTYRGTVSEIREAVTTRAAELERIYDLGPVRILNFGETKIG